MSGSEASAQKTPEGPGVLDRIQTAMQKAREEHSPVRLPERSIPSVHSVGDALWAKLEAGRLIPDQATAARLVTARRSDPAHTAFDMMRTRVLQLLRQNNWRSIAITSPTPGCGKTMVTLNLAFSLAHQKDCRTVVVDLDLRRPQIAKSLGIRNPSSMEDFLKGQVPLESTLLRYGDNVAVASNSRPVHLAAELLQNTDTTKALASLQQRLNPDVVLFDLPPMLANDDVMAFLPNVDCAILVVAAESSTLTEADLCERELALKTNVLGVVLNKSQHVTETYGY
ncbi:Chromosome partitioning ATPase, Mrp family, contains Fe-S cluster [Mesorhizobium albiziae]|uniref:Chromosome partitioning ATPase, Mrp family, contains Fe-S cluster n=2 Tax=Neomesorhizobium albiziae TaxID=335020 RepID=A0A1I3XJ27_9HYPH|nr:chromosome partitioning protein [Mesorhizobium albiziae]SFK19584.1 Chromosome partitioning ATPase, Mrp family, contains Fe-S cluster [Mesorhizobium albiziae]